MDLVAFTEETLKGKLHFLCSESIPANFEKSALTSRFDLTRFYDVIIHNSVF